MQKIVANDYQYSNYDIIDEYTYFNEICGNW